MVYSYSMQTTIASGKLTDGGLAILNEKIEQLNRRAVRLGLQPMLVVVSDFENITRKHESGIEYTVKMNVVSVYGDAPRINGWEVAARIEFTELPGVNLVHVAPGIEQGVKNDWRTVGNVCQHCNTKRRRNDLIVIRNEDRWIAGNSDWEMVVGRNCLADYIRTTSGESMLAYADALSTFGTILADSESEFWGGDKAGVATETLESFLLFTSVCVRRFGWVSGSIAKDDMTGATIATVDNVRRLLYPPKGAAFEGWQAWVNKNELFVNDFDKKEVEQALAFLASIPDNADNEYLHNLRVIFQLGYVQYDKMGYAASILAATKKAANDIIKRAEFAKGNANKGFIGTVGERLRKLPVTVKRTFSMDGNYGVKTIITFSAGDNELTWFGSGDLTSEYSEGAELVIDATVKDHKNHEKYGKSTIVNRVKIV